MHPVSGSGSESCVGDLVCPHRQAKRGSCYVNVGQSPTSVWHAYKRGAYASCLTTSAAAVWTLYH